MLFELVAADRAEHQSRDIEESVLASSHDGLASYLFRGFRACPVSRRSAGLTYKTTTKRQVVSQRLLLLLLNTAVVCKEPAVLLRSECRELGKQVCGHEQFWQVISQNPGLHQWPSPVQQSIRFCPGSQPKACPIPSQEE